MKDRQEKLYDAITMIDDDLISEADRFSRENGELIKKSWKIRIWTRVAILAVLLIALACWLCSGQTKENAASSPFEKVEIFDGTETIPAGRLSGGGLAGIETADYGSMYYALGEGPDESPIKDNTSVKKLSVYRSLRAESSDDTYRLLEAWAKDLADRARKEFGLEVTYDLAEVTINGEPYHIDDPIVKEPWPLYNLVLELHCNDRNAKLMCWSEDNVTFYDLRGIDAFYEIWSGERITVTADSTDDAFDTASRPLIDFIDRITGTDFHNSKTRIFDRDLSISMDLVMPEVNGSEVSRDLMLKQNPRDGRCILSFELNEERTLQYLSSVKVSVEYLRYLGEYELISLDEAKTLLEEGYFFGGTQCPICRLGQDAVDFSTYDLVQIEYYGNLTEYTIPYYAFYKHLGQQQFDVETTGMFPETGGLGEQYAVVYVPAVKVEGLAEYFASLATEHNANGHSGE